MKIHLFVLSMVCHATIRAATTASSTTAAATTAAATTAAATTTTAATAATAASATTTTSKITTTLQTTTTFHTIASKAPATTLLTSAKPTTTIIQTTAATTLLTSAKPTTTITQTTQQITTSTTHLTRPTTKKIISRQSQIKIIVPTTSKTLEQGPHHHPIYRYSCNEDLSVTFKGVNGIVEYFPATDKTDNCTIEKISGHNGNFKIAKECLQSINFKDIRWIQVAVYDKNEGETLPTTTLTTTTNNDTTASYNDTIKDIPAAKTSPKLITGHHIFNLTCLPLKEEGVDRIALAETGITDIEQLHHVYNEIGQVEMRFKESESLDKPDLSEVYIGDRFYMYLKYMGDTEGYIIVPQTCTAYKGNFRTNTGEQLELWKQSVTNGGDCITPEAKQYKVMENFKRSNKTIVHAELHGFRFSSELTGDLDDVTISCTVKVCTSARGQCHDNCTIVGNRRRRGIDQTDGYIYKTKRSTKRIRSQTVSQTIKVRVRMFESNNGGRNGVHGWNVAIIVVAGIVFWKSFR